MEKKQITPEIRKQLQSPLPPEAISPHPTKTYLSTIKAIYIVERLNNVFGIGRWTLQHQIVEKTNDYILMVGKLVLLDYDCEVPEQYGGHPTTGKNTEIADGYKSAVTDILSKCASYLEIGIDVFKGSVTSPATTPVAPAYTPKTPAKVPMKPKGATYDKPLCSLCKSEKIWRGAFWGCPHFAIEKGQKSLDDWGVGKVPVINQEGEPMPEPPETINTEDIQLAG